MSRGLSHSRPMNDGNFLAINLSGEISGGNVRDEKVQGSEFSGGRGISRAWLTHKHTQRDRQILTGYTISSARGAKYVRIGKHTIKSPS